MMDPVPWLVGGGAQHSPEVARLLAFAATGGAEGVVNVSDLKVVPLSVPGGAVEALPGAALVRNRGAGGDSQTYVARNVTATQVEIAATGSSGGRSDLVVVQVEDPNVAGEPWQTPPDPAVGPYVFVRVIPNVPAGATRLQDVPGYEGRSAVTLARVDLPASTGTVTAEMITDLRKVANPRRAQEMRVITPPTVYQLPATTVYTPWPVQANGGVVGTVEVPEWASRMRMMVTITPVGLRSGSYGNLQATLGSLAFTGTWDTQGGLNTDPFQQTFVIAGQHDVPASMRGGMRTLALHARAGSSGQSAAAQPQAIGATRVVVQIDFEERAA